MDTKRSLLTVAALTLGIAALAGTASAAAIVSGFNANTLPANDDGSTGAVSPGFNLNFFGTTFSQLYVNNNGNVTFGRALGTYTPFGLTTNTSIPIIAPFFADVQTNITGSSPVTYGTGTFNGHAAFGANWVNVDFFEESPSQTIRDNFQLLLVNRSDTGAGNFDMIFNYGSMQWETGRASGGNSNGLGGDSAHVGYSNGTGTAGSYFELAGSGVNGAFVNGGPDQLQSGSNVGAPGRYVFAARNGGVISAVPLPASFPLIASGLGLLGFAARRKRRGRKASSIPRDSA